MKRTEVKTIVNIPGWAEYFNSGKLSGKAEAFGLVPVIFRCFNLRNDSLSSVPLKLYKIGKLDKPVDWPWDDFDPVEWTWMTCANLTMSGASYSIKLNNKLSSKVLGLQLMNSLNITPELNRNENPPTLQFRASGVIGGAKDTWQRDEMLYIKNYNPSDDTKPGACAMSVALNDANLVYYMTRFAGKYFEQGAMPVTILGVERTTTDAEISRVSAIFQSLTSGIKNAWRVIALRGGKEMAPFKLTSDLKDLTMPALEDRARRAIAGAFGIPQTMIEDAANFATAKEHRLSFWSETIKPIGRKIESALNHQVLNAMGLEAHYDFDSLEIFQEDEAERAGQLGSLVSAGMDIMTACEILGYELTDEQKTRIAEKAQTIQTQLTQTVQPVEETNPQAMRSAMYNWKSAALKAVKTGNPANIEFDHPSIPEHIADGLHMALENCKTADEVHAVFREAKEWVKIPADTTVLAEQLKRANDLLEKAG